MENTSKIFDVIVIGAGVMGSSTAYQTAMRGLNTLLLDQFDFLHHRGSSHGESRTIRATYPEDYYSNMVLESSRLWEKAEADIGYKVYFKTIHFDMGPSDDKSLRAVISSCKKNSIPVRVLNHHQVYEEFSGMLELQRDWIGVVTEHGGVIKPTKAVAMFQTLAVKNGAMLRDNMEVIEIKKDEVRGGLLVCTKSGENFWGKKCVVTVGAWMKSLVKKVTGLVLPTQPLETTVHYWKINEGHEAKFTLKTGFPTFASHGKTHIYGTPSLEFPGLIKISVDGGRPCEPNERTWAAPPSVADSLRRWIGGRFGNLIDPNGPVMTQSCMYTMTPDADFVIDFVGGDFGKDLVVGGGFSGHGFKMAPVVGRILADLVTVGEAKGVDLNYFSIERFKGNPAGNVKDFKDEVNPH
ncbi:probable sarcosine oxidase [Olea europaea var. sylvestris]|uniref:Probable sarcosine oxidase n=2 Tax=Olea europaea subsp. europaea TaxID=158383 RepID=A0A8S0T9J7_OLEEU|nr:probable sarcosine oxidase [Olea europaea var. sylvestris]CAA3000266.1 probable sarcosine oxidase [Olea europaea subsp. europaea]